MNDQDVKDVVTAVLQDISPEAIFEGAEVSFENDWDGEPVIRVRARYARRPIDPDPLLSAAHSVRAALLELGEDRFVFLTNDVATERMEEPEEVD